MKNQKIALYALKLLALIFLSYLIIKDHNGITSLILIGFVTLILIWEGFRDFGIKGDR